MMETATAEDSFALGRQSAREETRALYRMLGHDGNSELIAAPPRIEWALRAYAKAHPEEAHFIDKSLMFRQTVALEFERLVREVVSVAEFPEVEEMDLGASSEAAAFAQA